MLSSCRWVQGPILNKFQHAPSPRRRLPSPVRRGATEKDRKMIKKTRPPRASGSARSERHQALITKFWPHIEDDEVWRAKGGYAQIPRVMPIVLAIADNLSGGQAVSKTYLELWCRSFEEGLVVTSNHQELAFFAGFSGQRAQRTWLERMRKLKELGFILTQNGPAGEFSYCLLLNPYKVIQRHYESKTPGMTDAYHSALIARAQEIGAPELSILG